MLARLRPLMTMAFIILMTTPVLAASHREAPLIANDPTADITDFYFSGVGRIPTMPSSS